MMTSLIHWELLKCSNLRQVMACRMYSTSTKLLPEQKYFQVIIDGILSYHIILISIQITRIYFFLEHSFTNVLCDPWAILLRFQTFKCPYKGSIITRETITVFCTPTASASAMAIPSLVNPPQRVKRRHISCLSCMVELTGKHCNF